MHQEIESISEKVQIITDLLFDVMYFLWLHAF